MTKVDEFCIEDNLVGEPREVISPAGRFRLTIRHYKTVKGCWDYTRGTVARVSDGQQICDIKRNYSSFTHSFVTKNDQEYLITGRSYTNQTIINLDTGEEFEPAESKENKSYGFCWVQVRLSPDENTLLVNGCHWACPYEVKFYDFTDLSKGWPELAFEDKNFYLPDDEKKESLFNADGSITHFETSQVFKATGEFENDIDYQDIGKRISTVDYDNEDNWEAREMVRTVVRRNGDKMELVSCWKSDQEIAKREKARISREAFEEWQKEFRKSDPLYLTYVRRLEELKLPGAASYEGIGQTYSGWCPDFKEKETRWCRRILDRNKKVEGARETPYTIDLDWAVKTGPIKVVVFKDGESKEHRFFPHSEQGMLDAFDYANAFYMEETIKC